MADDSASGGSAASAMHPAYMMHPSSMDHPASSAPAAAPAAPASTDAKMSMGQGLVWVVVAIFFIVILVGFFAVHHRVGDAYVASVRTHDALGYQAGFMQKQLNDMQYDGRQNLQRQYDWRLEELRFGQPYGNHTQPIGRRWFGNGPIVGSNLSTSTAVDGSVGNLGVAEGF